MTEESKPSPRLPALPTLLERKLYKTGQTRGADDDVIYQNRVSRSSTVLIPYACWDICAKPQDGSSGYENGFIVLISPREYFGTPDIKTVLARKGLTRPWVQTLLCSTRHASNGTCTTLTDYLGNLPRSERVRSAVSTWHECPQRPR